MILEIEKKGSGDLGEGFWSWMRWFWRLG